MSGVVSFDLDGTLWEFAPMMDGALQLSIEALATRAPDVAAELSVADLHAHRTAVVETQQGTLGELRVASFIRALAAHGVEDPQLAEWWAAELMRARVMAVEIHDDVLPAVERLRADGRRVGVITNGNFPFAELDLAPLFEFIVHAEDVGGAKPGPEPFARALELSGGEPSRWVHVGDDLEIDVAGAQAFGMLGVWVNRHGLTATGEIVADAEIAGFEELPAVVDRLLG
jgi:putative hydrolase of the HAD superfamily